MAVMNVVNRYSEPVEIQFDAAFNPESPYRWEPGEVKALPQEVALFCRKKSVVREDPVTGAQTRALLVQGLDTEYDSAVASGEFLPMRGPELLDRSNMGRDAQAMTYMPIANPLRTPGVVEGVVPESHARRV